MHINIILVINQFMYNRDICEINFVVYLNVPSKKLHKNLQ